MGVCGVTENLVSLTTITWVDRHAMFLSEAMRDIVFKPLLEAEMYITKL